MEKDLSHYIHAMIHEIGEWRKEGKRDIAEIKADIAQLSAKIDAVDAKVDAVDAKLSAKIDAVDAKVDVVRAELGEKIDAIGRKQEVTDARVADAREELRHTPRMDEISDLWQEYRRLSVRVTVLESQAGHIA